MKYKNQLILWVVLFFSGAALAQYVDSCIEFLRRQDETNDEFIKTFETFHDKESGVEFICAVGARMTAEGSYSLSCFPTGRKWTK